MGAIDRREPAVYVSIEDASYAAPAIELGRTCYVVTLCDRGPHNRVVKVTSKEVFHKLFGKPDIRRTSQAHYIADTCLDFTNSLLLCRVVPEDSGIAHVKVFSPNAPALVDDGTTNALFVFQNGSNTVTAIQGADLVSLGDWIYGTNGAEVDAAQVVGIDLTANTITLDRNYTGPDTPDPAAGEAVYRIVPVTSTDIPGIDVAAFQAGNPFDDTDTSVIYYFYANGAGAYYNNIKIKGVRNVEMEKLYVDADGNVKYPYLFMDIAVYYEDENGNDILLEGPWTVSLARRTPDGQIIRDLTTGNIIFIEDVINDNSDFVRCVASAGALNLESDETLRLQTLLFLSASNPVKSVNVATGGFKLEGGTDGTGLYDTSGNLAPSSAVYGLVKQAYMGSLTSVDGSIEQLPEVVYPWYTPDYILTGGYPADVQDGGRYLASVRQDCVHLADTGSMVTKYTDDLDARRTQVPWNDWTSALYVQYRKRFDQYTGQRFYMNPVFHAIQRHLFVDGGYFIAEPVAGIEKGAITEPIELAYKANHVERGDLLDVELNPVIVEPQGTYILSQYTTWKRLSVLKRLHVAKFVAYVRKVVPTLLKDILQRKATSFWIGQAQSRVDDFLSKFVESSVERYSILKSYTVNVDFDETRSELNVYISMTPIRAIERINVFISVA